MPHPVQTMQENDKRHFKISKKCYKKYKIDRIEKSYSHCGISFKKIIFNSPVKERKVN